MSLKKIAEITGVSYSTVSRVLSNPNYKCSSDELRNKILETARELNYIPNDAARNLKLGVKDGKNIFSVGLIIVGNEADNLNTFFNEMVIKIESEIHRSMCLLSNIWFKPEFSSEMCTEAKCRQIIASMTGSHSKPADGILIIGRCTSVAMALLKKHFKAVVCVNLDPVGKNLDEVTCSGKKNTALALEYLIKLGHRNIGYAGECNNDLSFIGFRDTLFLHNIELDISNIFECEVSIQNGYDIIEKLIQYKKPPTAIYCQNDLLAVGMLRCLSKYKNRYYMPSVISCGDIEESRFTKPMLTTIRIPKEEMAKYAVYLLLDKLTGGHTANVRIDLDGILIVRDSCTTPDSAMSCEYVI